MGCEYWSCILSPNTIKISFIYKKKLSYYPYRGRPNNRPNYVHMPDFEDFVAPMIVKDHVLEPHSINTESLSRMIREVVDMEPFQELEFISHILDAIGEAEPLMGIVATLSHVQYILYHPMLDHDPEERGINPNLLIGEVHSEYYLKAHQDSSIVESGDKNVISISFRIKIKWEYYNQDLTDEIPNFDSMPNFYDFPAQVLEVRDLVLEPHGLHPVDYRNHLSRMIREIVNTEPPEENIWIEHISDTIFDAISEREADPNHLMGIVVNFAQSQYIPFRYLDGDDLDVREEVINQITQQHLEEVNFVPAITHPEKP